MSVIFDNGYRAGQESCGKRKMNDCEGSQRKDEYMVGYCIARAEYEGDGSPMIYYSLGLYAGFYTLEKKYFKLHYNFNGEYDELFDSGYEDGVDERRESHKNDDYDDD